MILAWLCPSQANGATMIITLTGGDTKQYRRSTQKMDHNIQKTGLFSDNNLVRALEMHPPENLEIFEAGSFKACQRGGVTSFELFEAIKRGTLWVNLKDIHALTTPHGRLVRHMHKAFDRHMGVMTCNRTGDLQISSPGAKARYHAGLNDITLWHLRGRRRLYIYPDTPPFILPFDMQKLALESGEHRLVHEEAFETHRIAIDLEPGELICWPHLAPYRIENLDGLNVSMRLENISPRSAARSGAHYFDGYINRKYGKIAEYETQNTVSLFGKAALAALIKKTGKNEPPRRRIKPAFKISLRRPDCIEPI